MPTSKFQIILKSVLLIINFIVFLYIPLFIGFEIKITLLGWFFLLIFILVDIFSSGFNKVNYKIFIKICLAFPLILLHLVFELDWISNKYYYFLSLIYFAKLIEWNSNLERKLFVFIKSRKIKKFIMLFLNSYIFCNFLGCLWIFI